MKYRWLPMLVCISLSIGCNKSGGSNSELAGLLPKAPEGWKVEQSPTSEAVSGAGNRAWTSFKPKGASEVVSKVEVTLIRHADGAGKDASAKLSRVPQMSMFMEDLTIQDLPAKQSLPLGGHHVILVYVGNTMRLEVVVFARKPPEGKESGDVDVKSKTGDLFVSQIDWARLKAMKSDK